VPSNARKAGSGAGLKARRYKLKKVTRRLPAGQRKTLKLKLPARALDAGKAAVADDRGVSARIRVKAIDATGNSTQKKAAREVGRRE
jgi:hypothetical protein